MSTNYTLIIMCHKRSLEHTTTQVSCKKILLSYIEGNKSKSIKIHAKISICYSIQNIHKHFNLFVIRYKQYNFRIAVISEFWVHSTFLLNMTMLQDNCSQNHKDLCTWKKCWVNSNSNRSRQHMPLRTIII